MTLAQYTQALKKQWYIVLVLALAGLGAGFAYAGTVTPSYAASTDLFISSGSGSTDISTLQTGSDFTQQRVKSYADVVASPTVLDPVIDELGLPYTARELAGHVSAANPDSTVVLTVTVTDTQAARSAAIANAIAARFPAFVSALETTTGTSPVRVTVTEPAYVPDSPVAPKLVLDLAFGLIAGLALGLALAVLRQQLNTTVQTRQDVERVTGAGPLGAVPYTRAAARRPLLEATEQSARAEAFRSLRTNLQFTSIDTPPKVFVISSASPAEGKTTVAANLALTLALGGARVVLVDGDLRSPSVAERLGLSSGAGLTSVLSSQHGLDEVLVPVSGTSLSALPSGPIPPNPAEMLGSRHMRDLLAVLREQFDFVVIDAPPLLPVTDATLLAAIADGVVLVARHGRTTADELTRALGSLTAVNATVLGTVLNFAPRPKGRGYGYGNPVTLEVTPPVESSTDSPTDLPSQRRTPAQR